MSDCSSKSSSESDSSSSSLPFNILELLQLVEVLLLPSRKKRTSAIVYWQDEEIADLLQRLYDYYDNSRLQYHVPVECINTGRKQVGKPKIRLSKFSQELRGDIEN